VILAGDIGVGEDVASWIDREFLAGYKPVVFVAGNHEFYQQNPLDLVNFYRLRFSPPYFFLENSSVEIGKGSERARVLGATLWTSLKDGEKDAQHTFDHLSDRHLIGFPRGHLPALTVRAWHEESVAWLDAELSKPYDGKTIVVTHHAPLVHAGYLTTKDRPEPFKAGLQPAFSSDLAWLVEKHEVDLWAFGHTHLDFDEVYAGTRVFSQQRCYPPGGRRLKSEREQRGMPAFEPKVIEV